MKILLFLFLSTTLYAQRLPGFEHIPFTSSKETTINEMIKFENVKLDYERDDVLGFQGGEYISHKVYFLSFHFYDDQLHTIDVVFKRTDSLNRLRDDIINHITEKYVIKSSARLDNNGNFANTWYFVDSRHNPKDIINLILYEISTGETTYQLTFTNIELK